MRSCGVPSQALGPSASRKERVGSAGGWSPSRGCRRESPPGPPLWAPPPCTAPLHPRWSFSRSGVRPGVHTQVPLGVRIQLRVQGPTLWGMAPHNQHGVLVILQPRLGVALHRPVLHLPWQRQLELLPKVGGRRLGAGCGSQPVCTQGGMQTPKPLATWAPGSTPTARGPKAPGTSKEALIRQQTTEPTLGSCSQAPSAAELRGSPSGGPTPSAPQSRASKAAASPGGGAGAAGGALGARSRASGPRR